MKILDIKNECTACGACASVCPQKCISMPLDEEGFYYPVIDEDKCIKCGKCENHCHILTNVNVPTERASYYGCSDDPAVLNQSTSGGAFHSLAEGVLKNGGNVYGAMFDYNDRTLKHASTDDVPIETLMKSKYIESYMGNTAELIQKDIDAGRRVLFCGTPCQAAGVKSAVRDKEKLLTVVDFACHGVPSSMLFKEHLVKLVKNRELTSIDFRPKDLGWANKSLRVVTKEKTTVTPYYLDTFYKGFMTSNAILRRSCYDCKYRSGHVSDITIADFWGYRKLNDVPDCKNGLSLIIANTEHGREYLENIANFDLHRIDNKYSDYVYDHKDYSAGLALRKRFYGEYPQKGFEKAAWKVYMKGYYKSLAKYTVKKILRRNKN